MPRDSRTDRDSPTQTEILVLGGGNAGIALSARLRKLGVEDITLVEPLSVHTYRPLLNYAGAGLVAPKEYEREQATVVPQGVRWVQAHVVAADATARRVDLDDGRSIQYDHVVICVGSAPDWSIVPGSEAAMASSAASTNFLSELAPKTWSLIRSLRAGRAVFTIPHGPAPSPHTGQKILYLACDYWQRAGVLGDIDVTLVTPAKDIFGIPAVDDQLRPWVERYGIRVISQARVTSIDPTARSVAVSAPDSSRTLEYDLLHHVPQYAAPKWIAEAGLAADNGYTDIDPYTLQHRRVSSVWSCGDAADVATSQSGGGLRHQTKVLATNLMSVRRGETPTSTYDGYTVTPITVARGLAMVPEYDRDLRLQSGPPLVSMLRPGRLQWFSDRYVLPLLYWNNILKGR